tara:strand:+ start:269 stop:451 length:183 start_codon:yes stop_codon:yes gene_type:complete
MKVGDLVRCKPYYDKGEGFGIVTELDESHRQTTAYVLFPTGIQGPIWERYLEVINESAQK